MLTLEEVADAVLDKHGLTVRGNLATKELLIEAVKRDRESRTLPDELRQKAEEAIAYVNRNPSESTYESDRLIDAYRFFVPEPTPKPKWECRVRELEAENKRLQAEIKILRDTFKEMKDYLGIKKPAREPYKPVCDALEGKP